VCSGRGRKKGEGGRKIKEEERKKKKGKNLVWAFFLAKIERDPP